MKSYTKKIGVFSVAAALSFGTLAPVASASTYGTKPQEQIQIQISSTESTITKNDLLKKFKSFFPNQFDFLTANDVHMSSGHSYPGDDTIRYDLSFYKVINGKGVSGYVGFVGENLEIENFHYQPATSQDALFPGKVKKDEARKIAEKFIKGFQNEGEYVIEDAPYYYSRNQTLTEPIQYSFSFLSTKNKISIPDQRVEVTVLGNGDIVNFYRSVKDLNKVTFDDVNNKKDEKEILRQIKENLSVQLQYQLDYDYQTDERNIRLVYIPENSLAVNALTGKWQTAEGQLTELPKNKKTELISENPLPPKHSDFSLEKAKEIVQQLLAVQSDKVKLVIESIEETEDQFGKNIIRINYMYEYQNGGTGTSIEFDATTGEMTQYYDIKRDVLEQSGGATNSNGKISREQALNKAVEYLKAYVPSYLHHYAMPMEEYVMEASGDDYYFSFPRIVNGIVVSGDQISMRVGTDGSLLSFNVYYQEVDSWPSVKDAISEEKAKEAYIQASGLKLQYELQGKNHYQLIYSPVFNDNSYSLLDALTGEWMSLDEKEDSPTVSHPWAEEELNYLIDAKILKVKDVSSFNADAPVLKGDALEIIMKSLTYFYENYPSEEEATKQTFSNIDPDHPLYQVVERAVSLGIVDDKSKTFDYDKKLTREELAVWYIRALGLENAAKYSKVYQLNFKDAKQVSTPYKGHVALATSIGLLTTNNNQFNPIKNVSYAELAVSSIRLAHKIYEDGRRLDY